MKIIRLYFDYGAWPITLVEDNLCDYDFYDKITNKSITTLINEIEDEYESMFINDGFEFGIKGFSNEDSRKKFYNKCIEMVSLIQKEYQTIEIQNELFKQIDDIPTIK